jgi:hypothetical protein
MNGNVRTYVASLPPFQPETYYSATYPRELIDFEHTLYSRPNEIQQDSLKKWYVAGSETPAYSVLDGEPDMPFDATPRNKNGEKNNEDSRNDDHSHSLAYGQTLGCLVVSRC